MATNFKPIVQPYLGQQITAEKRFLVEQEARFQSEKRLAEMEAQVACLREFVKEV